MIALVLMPCHRRSIEAGISLSGTRSRVQRARVKLKEVLLACCHLEFDHRGGLILDPAQPLGGGCCPADADTCCDPADEGPCCRAVLPEAIARHISRMQGRGFPPFCPVRISEPPSGRVDRHS